ncbi:MAG: hypothetical protein C0596_17500 [Marinilabiliales bacterium]|nr:MAG: hypothetical protein C0596_17500 [Marinilabiliales bacterium]
MKESGVKIIALIVILSQVLVFCGKTETDIQWEEDLQAFWVPVGSDYTIMTDMPSYEFLDGNRGASYYTSFEQPDSFSWEIKRGQLKIYYDKAPAYYIGYDKYNSRSLFRIESFNDNDTIVDLIQFFSSGYQTDFYLVKSDLLYEQDDF